MPRALPDPTAANADPREVDGVYGAGIKRALLMAGFQVTVIANLTVDGEFIFDATLTDDEGCDYGDPCLSNSETISLLRAAQAAGVEQVVKIMEGE